MPTAVNVDNNQLKQSHLVASLLPLADPLQPPAVAQFHLTDNLK